jgi:PEGA domain
VKKLLPGKMRFVLLSVPLLCLLIRLPMYPQSAASVKSTPLYLHGEVLPFVTDAPHNINILCRMEGGIRKRFLRVFVGIHNTSTTADLNFDPSAVTLFARGAGTVNPMNAAAVRSMAKATEHRQVLSEVGSAVSNKMASSSATPDPQFNDRMRTDSMSDAAFAELASDAASIEDSNLVRASVLHGLRLSGYVYFDMGKDGAASDYFDGYILNIPLGGQIYAMDFSPGDVTHSPAAAPTAPSPEQRAALPSAAIEATTVQIASTPDLVDIEVDGRFVGNTPSEIRLTTGDHTVRLTREGLVPWEKTIHTEGGTVKINVTMKFVAPVHRSKK